MLCSHSCTYSLNSPYMIIISHRGNLNGPDLENENTTKSIDLALKKSFDVEIDVWFIDGKIFLGHDQPIFGISMEYLLDRQQHLWLHLKNFKAADFFFQKTDFNYFAHEHDPYVITSKGFIWSFPGKCDAEKKIVLMPEWEVGDVLMGATGVCTDYPIRYLKKEL
jgi:glycerophosphoryl diester phosphodiesterase